MAMVVMGRPRPASTSTEMTVPTRHGDGDYVSVKYQLGKNCMRRGWGMSEGTVVNKHSAIRHQQ